MTAHARVDHVFSRFDLADADQYAACLRAHADALLPIEIWLESRAACVIDDWAERRRRKHLVADLDALGHTATAGEPFEIATCPETVAGVLYVLEGSRFGAGVLAKRIGQTLPRSYLGAAANPGSWRALMRCVDTVLQGQESFFLATNAARSTFSRFGVAGIRRLREVALG